MQTFVGNKIRELRLQNKMSQDELAYTICVSRQTICKWENGQVQPSADNIKALCDCFGVTADELLNGTPLDKPTSESAATDTDISEKNIIEKRKKRILTMIIVSSVIFVLCLIGLGIAIYLDVHAENYIHVFTTFIGSEISISELICVCLAATTLIIIIVLTIYYFMVDKNHRKK